MKYSSLFIGFLLSAVLFLPGCKKHSEVLLDGTWEMINVADINATHTMEWVFENGQVTIFERSVETGNISEVDSGFYVMESTPVKSTLTLFNLSNELWNDNWNVNKLDNSYLILHLDFPQGVLFKEFIKIR
ncbi:MAG: hypothetical protein ABR597_11705 [Bacteroidales bacterium]